MNHVTVLILLVLLALAAGFATPAMAQDGDGPDAEFKPFQMRPIGWVRKAEGRTQIELSEAYKPGLLGLDGFSHVYVIYWFDRNDTPQRRATLQVHPRGNRQNPLTGVFATRSPARPNLIALTLCKIVSVRDNVVEVEKIDALPDTPVLDMKPYIPGYDSAEEATVPDWLRR